MLKDPNLQDKQAMFLSKHQTDKTSHTKITQHAHTAFHHQSTAQYV